MFNRIKYYLPAPTRTSPPDGPILLGNIIASPIVPEEYLNDLTPNPVVTAIKPLEAYKIGCKISMRKHNAMSIGFNAQVLPMIGFGGDIEGGRNTSSSDVISAERIDTYWFNPNKEQIVQSVADTGVRSYVEATKYRQPVFLITGIMVARKTSVSQTSTKDIHFHTQIGVDLTSLGAPVNLGPQGSIAGGHEDEVSSDESSDFVLAYRLMKIKITRKAAVSSTKYQKGALYSEPETSLSVGPEEDSYVTTIETEDVIAKDLNSGGSIEMVEGGDDMVETASIVKNEPLDG